MKIGIKKILDIVILFGKFTAIPPSYQKHLFIEKVIEAMTVIVQVALSLGFLSPIFGEVLFLGPMGKQPLGHSV